MRISTSAGKLTLTLVVVALNVPSLLPQANMVPTAVATTAFDVATIRPHEGRMTMMGLRNQPDGYTGTVTFAMLVQAAFGLQTDDQVSGGPDWTKAEWFDVQAKFSESDVADMQRMSPADANERRELMFRSLLAERFKLQSHSATKQVPVYELVVTKGISKLKDAATDSSGSLEMGKDGKPLSGYIHFLKDTSVAQGYSMTSLASLLSQPVAGVGRPVLDKTGLTGTYDFTLNWSVYSAHAASPTAGSVGSASDDDTASIFGALKEAGLKLQPSSGPIETVVIDHVERPSPD